MTSFHLPSPEGSPEQRIAAVHYCTASMSLYTDNSESGDVQAFTDLKPAVEKAWLVIEAVPENLDLKIKTFQELVAQAPCDAILCSNSSSYKSLGMVNNLDYRVVELKTDGETDEINRRGEARHQVREKRSPASGWRSEGSPSNIQCALLYFLDIGLASEDILQTGQRGRILVGASDGRPMKTLVSSQRTPDGLDISISAGKLFWTSMGMPTANDGAVYSYNLDGTDIKAIVPKGKVHTPKQLVVDNEKRQLYFSDREGLRVWRCNFDGQNLELLIQTGDYQVLEEKLDQTRWCVGVAFSHTTGKFYWTQKGPSKGFQGRISQDNIDFPRGQDGTNRTDIECLLQNLPEPIDLEVDGTRQDLYWTDRGGLPLGNNINRVSLKGIKPVSASGITSSPGKDYELVARNLHEAIGIKLDPVNHHIYTTNMGSAVYRFDFDGHNRKKFYEDAGSFTGITLAHV
ncbi:hypothetical protein MRS44_016069 [Fusarium solani]|uniref:uncharacterized protein n=1 Tax=Fusarium solani TaxID=169388 RepID=UPI0032C4395A|nr:hypothetical protein MRS44_016069 [Fusarium solani]